jgi:hypothetical protein
LAVTSPPLSLLAVRNNSLWGPERCFIDSEPATINLLENICIALRIHGETISGLEDKIDLADKCADHDIGGYEYEIFVV